MSNYEVLAQNILDLIGGKENIIQLTHCVTRLRFHLHDKNCINEKEIKELKGIIGTQWSGEQFQVIIGPTIHIVTEEQREFQ